MDGLNYKPGGIKRTYKKYAPGVLFGAALLTTVGLQVYGQAMGRLNLDNPEPRKTAPTVTPPAAVLSTPAPATVTPAPVAAPTAVPVAAEPEQTTIPAVTPTVVATPEVVAPPTATQPPVAPVVAPSMAVPAVAKIPVVVNPPDNIATSVETPAPVPGIRSALERNPAPATVTAPVAAATGSTGGTGVANAGESRKPTAPTGIEATDINRSSTGTGGKSGEAGADAGNETSKWDGLYSTCQVLGALGIVLGLIFIGKSLLKKIVPGSVVGSGKGVIEVLARYPLAKSQSLVLIRLGSQIVLLSQAKETSTSLLVVSDPNEVANILGQVQGNKSNSLQAGFSKLLSHASKDLEKLPLEANEYQLEVSEDEALPTGTQPMPRVEYSERLRANQTISVSETLDEEMDEMAAARRQLLELRRQVKNVAQKLPV